jgi:hypothetical protein
MSLIIKEDFIVYPNYNQKEWKWHSAEPIVAERKCLAAASTLLLLNVIVQVNVVRLFVILFDQFVCDQFDHPSESLVHVDLILQANLI